MAVFSNRTSDPAYPWSSGGNGKSKLTAAATYIKFGSGDSYSILFYKYDTRGLIVETSKQILEDDSTPSYDSDEFITKYKYDDNGNLTQIVYPSKNCAQYDYYSNNDGNYNQVETIRVRHLDDGVGGADYGDGGYCDPDAGTWITIVDDVTYYPWGDVESMRYKHDGTYYEDVTFTRGKWFQLKNIDVEDNSQNLLIHSKYTYDLDGNIATTSVDMDTATSDSYTESFTYNSLSMLTQAVGPYGSSGANKTYSYTYDDAGNRKSIGDGTTTYTYTYSTDSNKLYSVSDGSSTDDYTHDSYGNISLVETDDNDAYHYYTLTGRLDKIDLVVAATTVNLINNMYDDRELRIASGQSGEPFRMYTYDLAGRMLTEISRTTDEENENPVVDFIYLGNHRVAALTGQADDPCFIATAVMGTSMSVDINYLRAFRDRVLKKFMLGQLFVDWYYREGPKGATWLNNNPGWKPVVRIGLVPMISIAKIISASRWYHKLVSILLLLTFFSIAVYAGARRSWSTWKKAVAGISVGLVVFIAFGILINPSIASAVTEWPETYTSDEDSKIFFFYEDHIGRPIAVSEYEDVDSDGYFEMKDTSNNSKPIWQALYDPFGQATYDYDSVGIKIGDPTDYGLWWKVPFRFPGQYADKEVGEDLYYNWHRFYLTGLGRYNRADPIALGGWNPYLLQYSYALNNPMILVDPYGLYSWVEFGYDAANFSAGFGDLISFGITSKIRDVMWTNNVINKCAGFYKTGKWSGIVFSIASGVAGGIRSAGSAARGLEFSHWIPSRMGGIRSIWNGNYVSIAKHALSDSYRYRFMPKAWKLANPMTNVFMRQWIRFPNLLKGTGIGVGYASASSAANKNKCGCD